jgi:hypothetical protein
MRAAWAEVRRLTSALDRQFAWGQDVGPWTRPVVNGFVRADAATLTIDDPAYVSTGPHLQFEVHTGQPARSANAIDPMPLLSEARREASG